VRHGTGPGLDSRRASEDGGMNRGQQRSGQQHQIALWAAVNWNVIRAGGVQRECLG
jgi:hypothetical protein